MFRFFVIIVQHLLQVDRAGGGDCIAVFRQDGDMRRAVVIGCVEYGPVVAGIVHGPVVVDFPVPVVGPVFAGDVPD